MVIFAFLSCFAKFAKKFGSAKIFRYMVSLKQIGHCELAVQESNLSSKIDSIYFRNSNISVISNILVRVSLWNGIGNGIEWGVKLVCKTPGAVRKSLKPVARILCSLDEEQRHPHRLSYRGSRRKTIEWMLCDMTRASNRWTGETIEWKMEWNKGYSVYL